MRIIKNHLALWGGAIAIIKCKIYTYWNIYGGIKSLDFISKIRWKILAINS